MNALDMLLALPEKSLVSPAVYAQFEDDFYLSNTWTKQQLLDKAKAYYLNARVLRRENERLTHELATLRAAGNVPESSPNAGQAVCFQCGKVLEQATGGRKKKYCSESCKQKAKRQR